MCVCVTREKKGDYLLDDSQPFVSESLGELSERRVGLLPRPARLLGLLAPQLVHAPPSRLQFRPQLAGGRSRHVTGRRRLAAAAAAAARPRLYQTRNWVIGSLGQWVIWVIFHVRVTGSSF